MRLKAIELEAFRAFRDSVRLDLDADVVLILGRNGFGKTTIFDGICWCLFGHSPRFSGSRDFTRAGSSYLVNAFSGEGPPRVRVEFVSESGDIDIERRGDSLSFTQGNQAATGDEAQLRLLQALGFSSVAQEDDLKESLRSALGAFSRSFLLHQDLLSGFVTSDNPRARFDAFAQLFFITPIREFYTHLQQEMKAAAERRDAAAGDLQLASARLSGLQAELDQEEERLRVVSSSPSTTERVDPEKDLEAAILEISDEFPEIAEMEGTSLDSLDKALYEVQQAKASLDEREVHIGELGDQTSLLDRASQQLADLEVAEAVAETRITKLEEQLASEGKEEDALLSSLTDLEKGLAGAEATASKAQAFLSDALENVVSDVCPVCQRPIGREALVDGLRARLLDANPDVQELVARRAEVRGELESARGRLGETRAELDQAAQARAESERQRGEIARRKEHLEDAIKELVDKVPSSAAEAVRLLTDATKAVEAQLSLARNYEGRLLGLRPALELMARRERVSRLRKDVVGPLALVEENRQARDLYSSIEARLGELVGACKEAERETLSELIGEFREPIQEAYRWLSPHPLFQELAFELDQRAEAGELYFKVLRGEVEMNPATTFSSAQANALALAVFLSLNLTQSWSPLRAALIDDPVQSLDDVNVLGLIDFIRAAGSDQQLVISTALPHLGALLREKLRPASEGSSLMIHRFEAITEGGPVVDSESISFRPSPLVLEEIVRQSA